MQDAADNQHFELTRFLAGHTSAWGLVEDRFGRIRRRFKAEMHGSWSGATFLLDETFTFDDGEIDRRTWRVTPGAGGDFTATCEDCVGTAEGRTGGGDVSMTYRFRLKVASREVVIDFDDRIYRATNGIALNRATMRKWGIRVGELWVVFVRNDALPADRAA